MFLRLCYMLFIGPLDSDKTVFLRFNNTIVLIAGIFQSIGIKPKTVLEMLPHSINLSLM